MSGKEHIWWRREEEIHIGGDILNGPWRVRRIVTMGTVRETLYAKDSINQDKEDVLEELSILGGWG